MYIENWNTTTATSDFLQDIVSMSTAGDDFHIKEGVAGPQAGVAGTSPPPPSITIQANMELGTKMTT